MPVPVPASDPKQLRILKKLCNHLELTSGYEGIKVYRGYSVLPANEAKDTLSLLEAPRPITGLPADEENAVRSENWTLLLQGWPMDDKENPSDPAYYMKAAVEQRLSRIVAVTDEGGLPAYPNEYMLGRAPGRKTGYELQSLTVGQGVVRPPAEQNSSRLAMFYIPLVLGLTTDIRNPNA